MKKILVTLALLGSAVIGTAQEVTYENPVGTEVTFPFFAASESHFLGARISVPTTLNVTSVGVAFWDVSSADYSFFAAIVPLESTTALPAGLPFAPGEILASATFAPGFISNSFTPDGQYAPATSIAVPISALLTTGEYAVVVGSGLFGTSGFGFLAGYNPFTEGAGSSFEFGNLDDNPHWEDTAFYPSINDAPQFGMSISGTAVPEPSTYAAILGGACLIGTICLRRRMLS